MGTKLLFNDIVDEMLSRINTNKTTLGIGGIEERAEDPAVLDKVKLYGAYAYIVPLAEGRDRMNFTMGGTKDMGHTFSVNVTGYYNFTDETLPTALRTVRDHAFDLIDLFNGDDCMAAKGAFYAAELEQGYFENVDQIIHVYNVKFLVKVLEME